MVLLNSSFYPSRLTKCPIFDMPRRREPITSPTRCHLPTFQVSRRGCPAVVINLIGGAEGDRTLASALRIRLGKNVSNCLFESCSHQEISRVFPFLPIPSHPIYSACSYFWPRIGHLELTDLTGFEMPNWHLKQQFKPKE